MLENVIAADIHNADRVMAEWQDIAVGDEVNLAAGMPLTVAVVEPGRPSCCTAERRRASPPTTSRGASCSCQDRKGRRLLVRERYA